MFYLTEEIEKQWKRLSTQLRINIIKSLYLAGSGHPGGSLSAIDILVALYWGFLKHNPKNPEEPDRDRFILSKGHGCPALYVILAKWGYFREEELWNLRKMHGILQGHPDRLKTPGVEVSAGSLGHGLAVGLGMALAAKLDKKNVKIYVMLGDGEMQEGEIWESLMACGHYKVDNLCAILDNNDLQIDGVVSKVMNIYPLKEKIESFGWYYLEIDGHNFYQIVGAFNQFEQIKNKPTFIRAKTIKGKGVSFMENAVDWHGKAPNKEEAEKAIKELEKSLLTL
ncbi:MAG: transketolase [Planctomycetota bacterium]